MKNVEKKMIKIIGKKTITESIADWMRKEREQRHFDEWMKDCNFGLKVG